MTRDGQVMGKENTLPWHLPDDLKFFKETTRGHRVIMGRKTFDSLGQKPLPHRENWILSSRLPATNPGEGTTNLKYFRNKDEILSAATSIENTETKNFIIGGALVFELFWSNIDEIFVTWIEKPFPGDIVFPEVNWEEFKVIAERKVLEPFPHTFCHYMRKH